MSKFSEFIDGKKDAPFETNFQGSFDCQECPEIVDDAYYDRVNQVLMWKCPEGHMSFIEDFKF